MNSTSLALRCIISSVFEVWHLGQHGVFDDFRDVEGIMVEPQFIPSLIRVKSASAAFPDVWHGFKSFYVTGDQP